MPLWQVILLGLIEGLTEFIPVSSTGHLLLTQRLIGFCSPGEAFAILIQPGAILAVLYVYFSRLLKIAVSLPTDAASRRFAGSVLLAFLPAALTGLALGNVIDLLLKSPIIICISLILGGFVLLWVDRLKLEPRYKDMTEITPGIALKIGLCQCLALVPGVSRSGATIVGAMLLGTDKRTAAEFSFFLAMPTMAGAFAYDLLRHWKHLSPDDLSAIAVGFVVSFVTALVVVKWLLGYVSRHGFALFGWWRIIIGGLALGAMLVICTADSCAV